MSLFRIAPIGLFIIASASLAQAHEHWFEASLSGLNEFPQNGSPGTGFTRVTIDLDMFTMRVEATFANLAGNTTASHIHARTDASQNNGGVVTQTPTFIDFPLGVRSGSYDHTFDMAVASSYNPSYLAQFGGDISPAFTSFFNRMQGGLTYLNIHTNEFPGGELRGNLVEVVPEPATIAALGAGALALIAKRRKR